MPVIIASCAQQKIQPYSNQEKLQLIKSSENNNEKKETSKTHNINNKVNQQPLITNNAINKNDSNIIQKEKTMPAVKIKKQNTAIKNTIISVKPIAIKKLFNISGTVRLKAKTDKIEAANKEETVIYFIPNTFTKNKITNKIYTIKTQNKRFKPSVLVVPVGSTVTFPNQDKILHNVFSASKIAPFDLGLYAAGNQKHVQFNKPGIAYVNCNVHHAMHADILVIDTPHYVHLDKNNHFELNNLPTKKGKLYIWHPRAALKEIDYNGINKIIELTITRAKIPQHLNKFGSPYTKRRK